MPTLYKITGPNGECVNGGSGTWDLPAAGLPGAWWRIPGPIMACHNGLHLTDVERFASWWQSGTRTFIVETDGEVIDAGTKYVARAVRLVREVDGAAIVAARNAASDAIEREHAASRERVARARKRRDRAIDAALSALSIPAGWRAYLQTHVPLPKGHPARAYAVAIRDAEAGPQATYDRAVVREFARVARVQDRILADAMAAIA